MMMNDLFKLVVTIVFILGLQQHVLEVQGGSNEEGIQFLETNSKKDNVITLDSGLQYKIITKGNGQYHPSINTPCLCHYSGTLIDGTTFDSSYDRGEPTTFAPNQVIKGWTEAMQLMTVGDKWELYIPSDLAYGDHGSPPKIPGGSVLIFTMEIIQLQGTENDWILAINCNPIPDIPINCSVEEIKYITKVKSTTWDTTKRSTEQTRIKKMLSSKDNKSSIKPELLSWMNRRLNILNQLIDDDKSKSEL